MPQPSMADFFSEMLSQTLAALCMSLFHVFSPMAARCAEAMMVIIRFEGIKNFSIRCRQGHNDLLFRSFY